MEVNIAYRISSKVLCMAQDWLTQRLPWEQDGSLAYSTLSLLISNMVCIYTFTFCIQRSTLFCLLRTAGGIGRDLTHALVITHKYSVLMCNLVKCVSFRFKHPELPIYMHEKIIDSEPTELSNPHLAHLYSVNLA